MSKLFRRKNETKLDLTGKTPQIRCSICTGEQTGGYRDNATGVFVEVMRLSTDEDFEEFFRMCGTDQVERVY